MTSSSGGETHENLALRQTAVAGATAGDVTVTGIKENDALKSVIFLDPDGKAAGESSIADLTDEFEITGDDTINNGGETDTSNGFLLVTYIEAHDRGDDLNRS